VSKTAKMQAHGSSECFNADGIKVEHRHLRGINDRVKCFNLSWDHHVLTGPVHHKKHLSGSLLDIWKIQPQFFKVHNDDGVMPNEASSSNVNSSLVEICSVLFHVDW